MILLILVFITHSVYPVSVTGAVMEFANNFVQFLLSLFFLCVCVCTHSLPLQEQL